MSDQLSVTGLSNEQAMAYHAIFMQSTMMYVGVAVVAHLLVFVWRPWFPGVDGYAALSDTMPALAQLASALV